VRKKFLFLSILCPPIAKPHLREASTIQTKKGGLYINPEGLIYIAFLVIYYSIHYHYASKRYGVSVMGVSERRKLLLNKNPIINTTTKNKAWYSKETSKGFFLLLEKES